MATVPIELVGVRCPGPQLRLTTALMQGRIKEGDTILVGGDCAEFEQEMRAWCDQWGKTLVSLRDEGSNRRVAEILV